MQNITPDITYILGLSDNGGSTSELLRVLGGPGIGDIRSRLVRLIKTDDGDQGKLAIKELLSHRLPTDGKEADIKNEWIEVVEGTHRLVIYSLKTLMTWVHYQLSNLLII